MRNVEFQEVGMENYGPYIDPMIHTFNPDVLTLLTGPNGIGKTMSLDAIPFTLYGITSKKAKGDDVVNNVVGKNCKTWVKFKINDEKYLVTRYHKYTKLGNTVVLNKNGVDILKGHREVLPEIEKLLCPQKAFMNTLMFGQKVKDFFTDLLDSDKKEIFRKIIGLEQYILYYKQTDYKLKVAQTHYDVLTNDIKINRGILDNALEQIEILKDAKKKFHEKMEKDIQALRVSLKDNERLLKEWELSLKTLQESDMDIDATNKELSNIENSITNISTKTKTATDQLQQQKQAKTTEIQSAANEAKIKVQTAAAKELETMNETKNIYIQESNDKISEIQLQIFKLDSEKNIITHDMNTLLEKKNEIESNVVGVEDSICPTCEQEVTDETKEKLVKKAESYKKEISLLIKKEHDYDNRIKELASLKNQETAKYKKLVEMVNEAISKCKREEAEEYEKIEYRLQITKEKVYKLVEIEQKKIESRITDQSQELQDVRAKLILEKHEKEKLITESKEIQSTIDRIKQQIDGRNDQLKFLETQTYDETQLNSYLKKVIDLEDEMMGYKHEMIKTDEQMEMLRFWKTGFSPTGMPSMLIDESIPFMNRKVSEYLDMLTNGRYIVSFDTLDETKAGEFRDKISVRVIDTHTQANSRVQLSGGQTRIVDIATILTLGDLQTAINDVSFNILLFDEIFDALDYDNVGYVSKVLNKLKIGKSIFIISHQHQDQLEPDELLTLH